MMGEIAEIPFEQNAKLKDAEIAPDGRERLVWRTLPFGIFWWHRTALGRQRLPDVCGRKHFVEGIKTRLMQERNELLSFSTDCAQVDLFPKLHVSADSGVKCSPL